MCTYIDTGLYVYTYIYMCACAYLRIHARHFLVCLHTYMHSEFTWGCAYIYVYTHRVYMWMGIYARYAHIGPQSFHVSVYIFTYIHTEFTCVCVYNDDDCFYYHSWRNNVVIAFGTLSSFLT